MPRESPDSGFYIGQCDPCQAVIDGVMAEWNGLGYSGTNASGELFIINSVWRYNTAGVVPNTLDSELLPPFHDVTIAGNLIHDNDNREAPMKNAQWSGLGNGIILAGGNSSLVVRNRVVNHLVNGIAVTPNLDTNFWTSSFNRVEGNVVEGSGTSGPRAGRAGRSRQLLRRKRGVDHPSRSGFRLSRPVTASASPALSNWPEALNNSAGLWRTDSGSAPTIRWGRLRSRVRRRPCPAEPTAAVVPAVDVFATHPVDLESIEVPALPPGLVIDQSKGFTLFGVLMGSVTSVFFGLYAYLLPFVLYAAWVTIALWDLFRSNRGKGAVIGWTAAILLMPFLGVILYYLFGRSQIPAWQRMTLVFGGLGAYLVILAVGALMGGVV